VARGGHARAVSDGARSGETPFGPSAAGDRRPLAEDGAALPKVFVVTPSLDQAAYLRATIDSVLVQDYPNLDYFVADAGSTDGSVEILRSYGDRVRWRSSPDCGQAAAIAAAWQDSDADIVAWLNSDDTYLEGAIWRVVRQFERQPEAGLVYGKAWFIDERGERLRPFPTREHDAERLLQDCYICQPAAFVRREVFETIELPDRRLRYCMDYDLWLRLSKEFPVVYLEEFLACSRVHDESKTVRERRELLAEAEWVTGRVSGYAPRTWAVGSMIASSKARVNRWLGFLPRRARDLVQARLVQRLEAQYVGPLYSDLWAGTATMVEVQPDAEGQVRLRAESPFWPVRRPLVVSVEHEGRVVARRSVDERGVFHLEFVLPDSSPSEPTRVVLRASDTFVPLVSGIAPWEERPLSFLIR